MLPRRPSASADNPCRCPAVPAQEGAGVEEVAAPRAAADEAEVGEAAGGPLEEVEEAEAESGAEEDSPPAEAHFRLVGAPVHSPEAEQGDAEGGQAEAEQVRG